MALRRIPERIFCRVMGLTSTEALEEIAAFYGETPWWISDSHGLGAELAELGFARDYGWMKFSRGVGPRQAQSDLVVSRVGPERAADFAAVVAGGFGMPEWATPLAANVVGRPSWSCYVAYDAATPAGAGGLCLRARIGGRGLGGFRADMRG